MPVINMIDTRPASRQIADHIAAQISAGELEPGDRLPSTAELRRAWKASGETVRAAVDLLRSRGLVIGRHGVGVFVADWHPRTVDLERSESADQVAETIETNPSPEAAAALGIPTDTQVTVTLQHETASDGRIISRTVTTYPEVVDPAEISRTGPFEIAEVWQSRAPSPAEADEMALPAGVPVLALERTVTHQATPRWHELTLYHGPMNRIRHRRMADRI